MCDLCTKHGDGEIWYRNAANYARDLLSDMQRRRFIETFFETAMAGGYRTLGRLETLYRKKGHLPPKVTQGLAEKARAEHYGQVLPIEEIRDLILKAETVVRMPCACRWTAQRREERCCYGVSYGPEAWYDGVDMSYFGKAHDEGMESVPPETAILQMRDLEEKGAVHTIWTLITPFIGAVCNCTLKDCVAMRTLSGVGVETFARGEFVAVVDEALCEGCSTCYDHCQFGAFSPVSMGGRTFSVVDRAKCFGCGLCRNVCPVNAITLAVR